MAEIMDCTNIWLVKNTGKYEKVRILQTNLQYLGYYLKSGRYNLIVDGKFGIETEKEVIRFQKDHGLTQDGKVGSKETCPKINQLIKEKQEKEQQAQKTTTTTTTTTKNVTKATTPDPYKINTKNNVFTQKESNLHIHGIHFKSSSISYDNAFSSGNWISIQLANGGNYNYLGEDLPLKYKIETYLTNKQFDKLKNEIWKLGKQPCNVTGYHIESGVYTVSFALADQKLTHRKLTITLIEYK